MHLEARFFEVPFEEGACFVAIADSFGIELERQAGDAQAALLMGDEAPEERAEFPIL